jgi:hypothetical protein
MTGRTISGIVATLPEGCADLAQMLIPSLPHEVLSRKWAMRVLQEIGRREPARPSVAIYVDALGPKGDVARVVALRSEGTQPRDRRQAA